jgi:hypothetical protein
LASSRFEKRAPNSFLVEDELVLLGLRPILQGFGDVVGADFFVTLKVSNGAAGFDGLGGEGKEAKFWLAARQALASPLGVTQEEVTSQILCQYICCFGT